MYYPHADDEIVAMGYANYYNQTEENETMVTIDPKAFKTYMFSNYIENLDKDSLLDLLYEKLDRDILLDMAQNAFELPFGLEKNQIVLTDANELLLRHSGQVMGFGDCDECDDDDDDYDIITSDDDDWDDEEFAPYDDLDDTADEGEQ